MLVSVTECVPAISLATFLSHSVVLNRFSIQVVKLYINLRVELQANSNSSLFLSHLLNLSSSSFNVFFLYMSTLLPCPSNLLFSSLSSSVYLSKSSISLLSSLTYLNYLKFSSSFFVKILTNLSKSFIVVAAYIFAKSSSNF